MGEAVSTSHTLPFIVHHRERNDGCKSKKHEIDGVITDLDVGTIELPCKSQFSTHGERTEGPPLADSQPFSSKNSSFR